MKVSDIVLVMAWVFILLAWVNAFAPVEKVSLDYSKCSLCVNAIAEYPCDCIDQVMEKQVRIIPLGLQIFSGIASVVLVAFWWFARQYEN